METFRSIQGLRAIAALLVVMHHYNGILVGLESFDRGTAPALLKIGGLASFGGIGVPIFFVISGFVIGIQRWTPGWAGSAEWMAKRIARIVPLYWTVTIVLFTLDATTTLIGSGFSVTHLVGSLFFVSGTTQAGLPIVQPGWTLEYEMLFYFGFALIVVSGIARTKWRGELVLAALFGVFIAAKAVSDGTVFPKLGDPIIAEFLLGLLIARIHRRTARLAPLALAVAVCGLATIALVTGPTWTVIRLSWTALSFLLVLGLAGMEIRGRIFIGGRVMTTLGASSYAIYIIHMPLMLALWWTVMWRWDWHLAFDPHVAIALMIGLTALAGVAVHYLYERPVNAAVRKALFAALRRSRRAAAGDRADQVPLVDPAAARPPVDNAPRRADPVAAISGKTISPD